MLNTTPHDPSIPERAESESDVQRCAGRLVGLVRAHRWSEVARSFLPTAYIDLAGLDGRRGRHVAVGPLVECWKGCAHGVLAVLENAATPDALALDGPHAVLRWRTGASGMSRAANCEVPAGIARLTLWQQHHEWKVSALTVTRVAAPAEASAAMGLAR